MILYFLKNIVFYSALVVSAFYFASNQMYGVGAAYLTPFFMFALLVKSLLFIYIGVRVLDAILDYFLK